MNISYSAIKMHLVEIIFPPVDYVTSIFFDFFLNFLQFFLGIRELLCAMTHFPSRVI